MLAIQTSGPLLALELFLAFFAGCLNLYIALHLANGLRKVFTLVAALAFARAGGYGWILLFDESRRTVGSYESISAIVGLMTVWILPGIFVLKGLRRASEVAKKLETGVNNDASG